MILEEYVRKPFSVSGVRVTVDNMAEVAQWCNGVIATLGEDEEVKGRSTGESYIRVNVQNPGGDRQTMAFAGDWVLYAQSGYKCYTNKSFQRTFEEDRRPRNNVQTTSTPGVYKAPVTTPLYQPSDVFGVQS